MQEENKDDADSQKENEVEDESDDNDDKDAEGSKDKFLNYKPTVKLQRRGTKFNIRSPSPSTSTDEQPLTSEGNSYFYQSFVLLSFTKN